MLKDKTTFKHNMVSIPDERIDKAIDTIYDLVSSTFGPFGNNVFDATSGQVMPTKDGLKAIESFKAEDNVSSVIHRMVYSVASKQNQHNGDGSTTMMMLFVHLCREFPKLMKELNVPPSTFNNVTRKVVDIIINNISSTSIPLVLDNGKYNEKILLDLIKTSVDGDIELSETVFQMFMDLQEHGSPGIDPSIDIVSSYGRKDTVYELNTGMGIPGVPVTPEIFFNGRSKIVYELDALNPIILIDGQLNIQSDLFIQLAEALNGEKFAQLQKMTFVCCGINESLLNTIHSLSQAAPQLFSKMAVFVHKHLHRRDDMQDIASILGCNILDESAISRINNQEGSTTEKFISLSNLLNSHYGYITNGGTMNTNSININIGEDEETKARVAERLDHIREIKKAVEEGSSLYSMDDVEKRMALISKNSATIYIGGVTSERLAINREFIRDVVPQVLSAREHGVTMGMNHGILNALDKVAGVVDVAIQHQKDLEKTKGVDIRTHRQTVLEKTGLDINEIPLMIRLIETIRDGYTQLTKFILTSARIDQSIIDDKISNVVSHMVEGVESLKGDDSLVWGSANTDKVVLTNATDMAIILTTTKYLTIPTMSEIEPLEMRYNI